MRRKPWRYPNPPTQCVASPVAPTSAVYSVDAGTIAPMRYRQPLGDRDIRDIRDPSLGTEIEIPDLPVCLDRRVRPQTLREAAEPSERVWLML